jgi:hypothetical protein
MNRSKEYNERRIKLLTVSVEWDDDYVWILLNLIIISGTSSIKLLLLEAFSDEVHNEGLQNGFEDVLIPFHGHKMAIGLVTSMDRSSYKKSGKV